MQFIFVERRKLGWRKNSNNRFNLFMCSFYSFYFIVLPNIVRSDQEKASAS